MLVSRNTDLAVALFLAVAYGISLRLFRMHFALRVLLLPTIFRQLLIATFRK